MNIGTQSVLVTGAGGFIGSHLTEALVRKGCRVKAFLHYNSANSWGWIDGMPQEVKAEIEVVTGDICDPFGVKSAMRDCQVVFHLAALIAIPYSYHSPATYVDTNVKGTLNAVQAARELGVQKFVQTSTSEVYGTALFVPITEEHPLQGQSPYSASKIGADQIALSYFRSFETPICVCRPFNTYGPRQSARAVIPTIISQLASGSHTLKLGAVHPTRDFNYAEDTALGFIACAESDASNGEVINIGSGYEISIGDTARLISDIMGKQVEIVSEDARLRPDKSEVERLLASNEKAGRLLSWAPTYRGMDGLRRGLEQTVRWFLEPSNLARYKPDIYNI